MRLLEAAAVSVSFGGTAPLPGPIDLTLDAGEVLSLEGPSGAGKTTLLRALALLDARMHGEVRHRGAVPGPGAIPAFRRKVVYLPQKPPALPGTTEAVLCAPFALKAAAGVPFDPARARALLARLGLPEEAWTRRLEALSVGEAQRVLLARALLVEPEVLLLDEPTSALDPASRDAAEAAVAAWLVGGERAAILVSHDPASSARLRTRRLRLAGGRLEAVAP